MTKLGHMVCLVLVFNFSLSSCVCMVCKCMCFCMWRIENNFVKSGLSFLRLFYLFLIQSCVGCVVNMSQHACVSRKTVVAVGLLLPSCESWGLYLGQPSSLMAGAFTTESSL